MCPTEGVSKKKPLIHHMVRFHQRDPTSVAPNGSSQRKSVRRLFKKLSAKYREKVMISSMGRATASNGSS